MTLTEAIFNVQSEASKVFKDAKNPHHNSKFASLESVFDVINDHLHKHNLVIMQYTHHCGEHWLLTTEVTTADGKEQKIIQTPLLGIEGSKNPMQALGSAITYARRYSIMALFKLAPTDDDAEHAGAGEPTMTMKKQDPLPPVAPRNFAPTTGNLSDFIIKVGKKYVGKKLSEVDPAELNRFVEFVENAIHNPQPAHNEFLANAKAYLKKIQGEDYEAMT